MSTNTQVALQDLGLTAFLKAKLFLTVDPAFNIGGISPFFYEGKIRKVSLGINEHIGITELEYPNRPFGSRIGTFCIPTAIFLNNTDNFVFRGFYVEEEGVLDESNDQVNATIYDYKWFLNKLTRIKGKIYTVDNNIYPEASPGNVSVFADERMYEKFRLVVPGLNKSGNELGGFTNRYGTGYFGAMKTIFNENSSPDCAAEYYSNPAFMFDADLTFERNFRRRSRSNNRYWWNYAGILNYVVRHYISNVFSGNFGTTKILLNMTGLSNIIRFGNKNGLETIRPLNFDITSLSPMEAIDKVVKNIPGSWYWRLLYFPKSVVIDIQNHSDTDYSLPGKSLFIGDGGKVNDKTNNKVNVAKINIRRSIKNAISHAIAVGRPIEIETSIQYLPGWPQYLRPVSDLDDEAKTWDPDVETIWDGLEVPGGYYVSDFKGFDDYEKWTQFAFQDKKASTGETKSVRESIPVPDQQRYALIYRAYVFPENQFLITKYPDAFVSDLLGGYENYVTYLDQLFFKYVLRPRKIKSPITLYKDVYNYASFTDNYRYGNIRKKLRNNPRTDPPFVFLYDGLIDAVVSTEGTGRSDLATRRAILKSKKWIIPQEEKNNSYSLDRGNRVLLFQNPQYQRRTVSYLKLSDEEDVPNFDAIIGRRAFVTCRLECDVPLIKDKIQNRHLYSNARLVSLDVNHDFGAIIRVNAFYPNPKFYVGDDLDLVEDDDVSINGTLDTIGESTGVDASIGAKLIDGNRIDFPRNTPPGVVLVDDTDQLNQVLSFLLESAPAIDISADVDLGRIDASFLVGDRLENIIGSELADGTGGYYGLGCVIDKLEYSAADERSDTFTSKIGFRNDLGFVTNVRDRNSSLAD